MVMQWAMIVGPRSGHVMELAITSHAMTTCSQPERAVAGSEDAAGQEQCVWCTSEKTTRSGAARVLPRCSRGGVVCAGSRVGLRFGQIQGIHWKLIG